MRVLIWGASDLRNSVDTLLFLIFFLSSFVAGSPVMLTPAYLTRLY